jgi:uncharacterized protein YjbI with pentapeptide repeats
MANEELLAILRQGVEVWNAWREENPTVNLDLRNAELSRAHLSRADLSRADLSRAHLSGANLSRADLNGTDLSEANLSEAHLNGAHLNGANLSEAHLSGANLSEAHLSEADLSRAHLNGTDLSEANLSEADLYKAILSRADLSRAHLSGANLRNADLSEAILRYANLSRANLSEANLSGTDLYKAILSGASLSYAFIEATTFGDNDLSEVNGLDTVRHLGPSMIGIDTLYRSGGKIPEVFLRGCGVPDALIEYLPSLLGAMQPIQFYSCFISYSTKDKDFAQRLYERMQSHHLRVWYAPEEMKGGQKLHEQIDQAIRVYEKLVLVLSEHSIQSEWVMTELYNARQAELQQKRRKLFPISLTDMDTLKAWKCFDADTGKDLAREVREYFIPDFTRWKEHDAFEHAFARFLKDLQAVETTPVPDQRPVEAPRVSGQSARQGIIATKRRRLRILEEQQVRKGHDTPADIVMEIEDLQREIAELDAGQG